MLSLLIFCSATLHIRAEYGGPRWQVYLFKPLTTLLIMALALLIPASATPFYKTAIIVGLVFSLLGDIFLMLPDDHFIWGLLSFLLAHLCYIAAFVSEAGSQVSGWLLPFVIYGIMLLRILWPHLNKMKVPVIVYALVILVMGWQAAERGIRLQTLKPYLAAAGAILFMISDSVLALNRFGRPFRLAQLIVLSTYFTAQWLIALSV